MATSERGTGAAPAGTGERVLRELSESENAERLATVSLGRVGVLGSVPAILPVNFALLDHDVVFRTDRGAKLSMAVYESLVVFEADDIDSQRRTGWSVVVLGHAEIVTDRSTLARVDSLPLEHWLPGLDAVVRIRPVRMTGRELIAGADV